MNNLIAVAKPVVEEHWEPLLIVPKNDSALFTTFIPLLGLLFVYGTVLVSEFAGMMP